MRFISFKHLIQARPATRLPILFLHTPKTAGTSFRKAAQHSKKIRRLICDYGKDHQTTTPELNHARYHSSDGDMSPVLSKLNKAMLTGHFISDRYLEYFYPYQVAFFIREPTQRIISDYFHRQRQGYTELDLDQFIETRPAKNQHSRQAGSLPIQYFGFVGISEQYKESLSLFNQMYHLDLEIFFANENPDKDSNLYDIPLDLRQKIQHLNTEDYTLNAIARELFEVRSQFTGTTDTPLYGEFFVTGNRYISGRAYRAFTDQVVTLEVRINNMKVATVTADLYDPIPCNVKQPRNGNIGFKAVLDHDLGDEDQVSVLAIDTNEPLFKGESK